MAGLQSMRRVFRYVLGVRVRLYTHLFGVCEVVSFTRRVAVFARFDDLLFIKKEGMVVTLQHHFHPFGLCRF